MESYEEFRLKSLTRLQEEGTAEETCRPLKALSVICFHGRAVLSPLLSAEQRRDISEDRRRAVQVEEDRRNQQRNSLLARVQDIVDQAQAHRVPDMEKQPTPPYCLSPKPDTVSGYTLITDSPGLPRDPGVGAPTCDQPTTPQPEPPSLLNGYTGGEEEAREEKEQKTEEDEDEDEDMSLDSLLKRSREYVEREQSRRGSKVTNRVTRTPPPESLSDKENEGRSPLTNTGTELGFSLHHSPVGPQHTQVQHQAVYDTLSPGLPSPEPSLSPRQHRRRPRPISTGNIHISFPIGPADLIPRSPGRSREGVGTATWCETLSGGMRLSDHRGLAGIGSSGDDSVSSSRRSSHCGSSPVQEICGSVGASGSGAMGHQEYVASGFRRRCHTLDSQTPPSSHAPLGADHHIDRSQERVPRFMAGVARLPPSRRTPTAPLNQSYEVENPSPSLLRPHVTPDLSQVQLRSEADGPEGPNNGRITPTAFSSGAEQQGSKSEEAQRRVQALEDMQRRLEEEHVLQMSVLLAEQEKEQQCLRQELEEKERRRREQGCDRPLSADAGGWDRRSVSDGYASVSPAHTPAERSPGHSIGLPSPLSSRVSSPSVQPPVYLWGPTWGASKPRARLSQVLTAEQQRALCRLGAITRGFLARRLLKTEKVRHLRQTVLDTQEFIRSFQTEAPQKKASISTQDLSLQERVRAQLRAALYDVHDIFFEMPLDDRLALLQQDRELRAERRLREMEKAKGPKERVSLSAATQRSLDRKKRVGESPGQARKTQQKPKSPTTNRILKPSQGQNAPIPGQLNRQGSWYRKTPEERVRRSDSLKKQHSLG